jgi:hypothetical protein
MKERAALLSCLLTNALRGGAEQILVDQTWRGREILGERARDGFGPIALELGQDLRPRSRSRRIEPEDQAQSIGHLVEPIDRSRRNRQDAFQVLQSVSRRILDEFRVLEIRHGQGHEPRDRRRLQVMAIGPRQLLLVEHAGAVADPVERKAARELVERQELVAAAGRPSHEREIVGERLGEIALRAKFRNRCGAVPLRQRRMIRAEDQREVREPWRRPAQSPVKQNLPRRVRDVILTADHVRHAHQPIVHDHGEIVGG